MAKVARKSKQEFFKMRTALHLPASDVELLEKLRIKLCLERGGPVSVSETIRDAIRFSAKKRGLDVSA